MYCALSSCWQEYMCVHRRSSSGINCVCVCVCPYVFVVCMLSVCVCMLSASPPFRIWLPPAPTKNTEMSIENLQTHHTHTHMRCTLITGERGVVNTTQQRKHKCNAQCTHVHTRTHSSKVRAFVWGLCGGAGGSGRALTMLAIFLSSER